MIQAAGLGRRGLNSSDHPPPSHGKRSLYGVGRTSHDPPSKGRRSMYGVNGAWGDFGRDILGDVVGTGLEVVRDRQGLPGGVAPAPVVVVQQSSIPWKPILIVGGVLVGGYLLMKMMKRR